MTTGQLEGGWRGGVVEKGVKYRYSENIEKCLDTHIVKIR